MSEFTQSTVSPFPNQNILFNSASGITGQQIQQNQLGIQQKQLELTDADHEQVARLSAALLNEPDLGKRGDLYSRGVGMLQSQGLAKYAPPTLPDESTLRMLAAQGTPSADLYKQQLGAKALDAVYPGPSASTAPAGGGTTSGGVATAPAGTIEPAAFNNATAVRDGLIKRGVDPDTATALAANALHESIANPATGRGDRGNSAGLFQWAGPRLQAYTDTYGHSPDGSPLDEQLDNVVRELKGSEAAAAAKISEAQGPAAKAAAVSQYYLRPKDTQGEMQRRSATALQLQQQIGGGTQTAAAPTGGVAARTGGTDTAGPGAGPVAPPGSTAAPTPLPPDQAVAQAKATGQPVPVAGSQGLWALPSGNLTSTPPTAAPPAATPPAATTAPAVAPLPPDQLTPQDHTEIARFKAALVASGRPDAPVLLQAEIDRRRTANVAAQHQTMEEQRQAKADALAAEKWHAEQDKTARDVANPFGDTPEGKLRYILSDPNSDPKSPTYHAAWAAYANPQTVNGVTMPGHVMAPFRMPLDSDGQPVTTYDKPAMTLAPGDLTQYRKITEQAGTLTAALDDFAKASRNASLGERVATVAGASTDLHSAWTNSAMLAKGEALYQLGVLSGPDMQVIRGALADPSTFMGSLASNDTIDKQVARIKRILNTRLEQARESYLPGVKPPESTAATPTERPPLSSFQK
jgi:hypothetical protein